MPDLRTRAGPSLIRCWHHDQHNIRTGGRARDHDVLRQSVVQTSNGGGREEEEEEEDDETKTDLHVLLLP